MLRPRFAPVLLLTVALASLTGHALSAQPPVADPPVHPLGAVVELPASGGPGFGTPAVALRPGGGFVAVWSDLPARRIVGRSFGSDPTQPGSATFVLSEGDVDPFGPVLLARGEGDAYLAVWIDGEDRMLHSRAFDGDGQPLSPVAGLSTTSLFPGQGTAALASSPGGDFVLAWWQELGNGVRLAVEHLALDGQPMGGGVVVDLAPGSGPVNLRLAVGSSRAVGVSWSEYRASESTATLRARVLDADLEPLGPVFELAANPDAHQTLEHDLAATGGWDFLLAWTAPAGSEGGDVLARRFGPDGTAGPERWIDSTGAADEEALFPAVAAVPGGAAVVAWAQGEFGSYRVMGRLVEVDGTPRGLPFEVHSGPVDGDFLNGLDVDRDLFGRIVAAWGLGIHSGAGTPVASDGFVTSQAVRLLETQPPCGPLSVLALRSEPETPNRFQPTRLILDAVGQCAELSVTDWSRDGDTIRVETFLQDLLCDPPVPLEQSLGVEVGTLPAGSYSVVVDVEGLDGPLCTREASLPVTDQVPEPPPQAPLLMSDELPGFAALVQFTDPLGNTTVGTRGLPCIPETLCVIGNLPGRSELFIRVVGPKPNGRLWPTLVKFSTSTVEVWLVQWNPLASRYYRLEGAAPGIDELPGLFDREGFEP